MSQYSIRPATEEDIPQITQLGADMVAESPHFSYHDVSLDKIISYTKRMISNQNSCFYVADRDGEVLGFISGYTSDYIFTDGKLASEGVWFVDRKHRKGLTGVRLVKTFIAWGKDMGCKEVLVGISSGIETERIEKLLGKFDFDFSATIMKRGLL